MSRTPSGVVSSSTGTEELELTSHLAPPPEDKDRMSIMPDVPNSITVPMAVIGPGLIIAGILATGIPAVGIIALIASGAVIAFNWTIPTLIFLTKHVVRMVRDACKSKASVSIAPPLPSLPSALTDSYTFNMLFNNSTVSHLSTATDNVIETLPATTNADSLIKVMNRLFQNPIRNLEGLVTDVVGIKQGVKDLFNSKLDYSRTSDPNPKSTTDAATIQFLEFSYLVGHLRKKPTLLPEVDRDEFDRAYAKFRDEKFLPYCEAKYGVEATNTQVRGCIIPTLKGFVERGEDVSLELFPEHLKRAHQRDEQDRQRDEQDRQKREQEGMSMEDGLMRAFAQQLSGEEKRKGRGM